MQHEAQNHREILRPTFRVTYSPFRWSADKNTTAVESNRDERVRVYDEVQFISQFDSCYNEKNIGWTVKVGNRFRRFYTSNIIKLELIA